MKPVLQVFAGDFAAKALLGVAGLALIRFLPEAEYAVLTLATVLSAFVEQGITGNLNRIYIIGHKRLGLEQSSQSFLALQMWLLALLVLATAPFAPLLGGTYWLVVALTVATCLLEFVKTFYQRNLKFASFSLLEAARTLAFVAALAVLIGLAGERLRAWQVLALQSACTGIVVIVVFGKSLDPRSLLRFGELWRIARMIVASRYLYMIGYFLGVAMLVRLDVMMLGALDSRPELATFGASFRYYSILMMLLAAMHTVFLPMTQNVERREDLAELFGRYQRLIAAAVPLILVGAWASQWIIPAIDGGKYPGAVGVFQVLSLSAIVSLACSPHANLLLRYDAFRFLFGLCSGAIMLNVGLNALLIPRYHALGAAWATLVAVGAVNGAIYFKSRSLLATHPLPEHSAAVPAG